MSWYASAAVHLTAHQDIRIGGERLAPVLSHKGDLRVRPRNVYLVNDDIVRLFQFRFTLLALLAPISHFCSVRHAL